MQSQALLCPWQMEVVAMKEGIAFAVVSRSVMTPQQSLVASDHVQVRARMLYSTGRAAVIATANEHGITFDKVGDA